MTREEAAEQIYGLILSADDEDGPCIFSDQIEALEMGIEALKQPEQKKGKWIVKAEGPYQNKIGYCSRCRYATSLYHFCDYCPHCGAKMEEEQCQPKDDTSHPFADDVLMRGD